MRYTEADLLHHDEARDLMRQIDRWCRRTGTGYNKLVTAARVPPNTRARIRQGKRRLTRKLADRLVNAMRAYPHGIDKAQHRINRMKSPSPAKPGVVVRVSRDPCAFCGIRGDIGCKHQAKL